MSGPGGLGAKPTVRPASETFRCVVSPGRHVDLIVPPRMTETELLVLVSSIAGGMREQLARPRGLVAVHRDT